MRRRAIAAVAVACVAIWLVAAQACNPAVPEPAEVPRAEIDRDVPAAARLRADDPIAERRRVAPPAAAPRSDHQAAANAEADAEADAEAEADADADVVQDAPASVPVKTLRVTIVDDTGLALAGAEVVLFENRPHGGYDAWREKARALTDTAGRASLEVSNPYGLQVRATHGELEESQSLRKRSATGELDVTLRLRKGMRSHGRVVDADTTEPIEGARVQLFHAPWSQVVTTDIDGRYVSGPVHQDALLNLAFSNGPSVSAPGYDSTPASTSHRDGTNEIRLTPTTRVTFRLISEDGRPRRGRSGYVKTRRMHTGHLFETDRDGIASVDVVLEPGALLEVRPKGSVFVLFPSTPERAHTRDLGDVTLADPGTVEGIVVDSSGEPVHDAIIWLFSNSGGYARDIESTDIDGLFELENTGPEQHVITVNRRGGDEELRVTNIRSGDRDVRLVLPTREDD